MPVGHELTTMPPAFWNTPGTIDALAERDIGQLFRLIQRVTGGSQTKIGSVAGLSQAQVSEIMAGKRQVSTVEVLARIVEGFAIPDPARTVLLLGNRRYADEHADRTAAMPAPATPTEPAGRTPGQHAGVSAIYASRSEFAAAMPAHAMFDGATTIRAAGLSLNLICQHYATDRLAQAINAGTRVEALFLDPTGEHIKNREREESFPPGFIAILTEVNIHTLVRVRDRLHDNARDRLTIAAYDQAISLNLIFVDDRLCIAQPYLPATRGIDSPTFVIRPEPGGLYRTFDKAYATLREHGKPR